MWALVLSPFLTRACYLTKCGRSHHDLMNEHSGRNRQLQRQRLYCDLGVPAQPVVATVSRASSCGLPRVFHSRKQDWE